MIGIDEPTSARGVARLGAEARPRTIMAKAKKKKKPASAPGVPAVGRLGAEQWLAVRLKSGAGPMEPKARRQTRAEREREALERDQAGAEDAG